MFLKDDGTKKFSAENVIKTRLAANYKKSSLFKTKLWCSLDVPNMPVPNLPVPNLPVPNMLVPKLPVSNLPVPNLPVSNLPVPKSLAG